MFLNVAAWLRRSPVNGPGCRFVLWVQGCARRCPGCVNEGFQPFVPATRLSVVDVFRMVAETSGIEGVTFSGGEPFEQAAALSELCARVREAGLSVMAYTGYTLEELRARPEASVHALLERLDLLVDGPYLREERAALRWRASRNQRIHALTGRYRDADLGGAAAVELVVSEGAVLSTGAVDGAFFERLSARLSDLVASGAVAEEPAELRVAPRAHGQSGSASRRGGLP